MVWLVPAAQDSPPFGTLTVILGGGGPVIVKVLSLMSLYALFVVLVDLYLIIAPSCLVRRYRPVIGPVAAAAN